MEVPPDAPDACAVCNRPYDSLSAHDAGVMVNLLDNERYQRVCFQPKRDGRLWFYHHTHEQAANGRADASEEFGVSTDATEGSEGVIDVSGHSAGTVDSWTE